MRLENILTKFLREGVTKIASYLYNAISIRQIPVYLNQIKLELLSRKLFSNQIGKIKLIGRS